MTSELDGPNEELVHCILERALAAKETAVGKWSVRRRGHVAIQQDGEGRCYVKASCRAGDLENERE
jgi:hypothetical protein